MVLPVGLVSLADKDRDVHPLHVHLKLPLADGSWVLQRSLV
jgi:hypothetical protein